MNYLAHAYLSGDNPLLLVGNMMGDAVKGTSFLSDETLPPDVIKGIRLHRFIDDYTDNHPLCIQGKKRLWDKYRHFAGILTDMYYDHLLASNWSNYSETALKTYAQNVYRVLKEEQRWLPIQTRHMMIYMEKQDWLASYSTIGGISQALGGLSRRTIAGSGIEKGTEDLVKYFEQYKTEFEAFFEDIQEQCAKQIELYE